MIYEDRQTFMELSERYHIDVETSYPYWQIDYYRNCMLHILEQLINNITVGSLMMHSISAAAQVYQIGSWAGSRTRVDIP